MKVLQSLFIILFSLHISAQTIDASHNNGTLSFAGEHAGMAFRGVFETWQAKLVLPPVESPFIKASFALASAKTGDSTYDETLPEEDWFHVDEYSTATFTATDISKTTKGFYVSGTLSLKGKARPITFTLIQSDKELSASFNIDRLAYDIGSGSDPEAEWVSQMISMELKIEL